MLPLVLCIAGVFGSASSTPAAVGSHSWRVNEVFSNANGTIQFIELAECCGMANETGVAGKALTSTANAFPLPTNLPAGSTANAHILFGTAAFAALPGAPAPDHIIPDGFFDINTDTLQWHIYTLSVLNIASGQLPLDGFNSLSQSGVPGPNTPTNFAGQSGQINLAVVPAFPLLGLLSLVGLLGVAGALLIRRTRRA